VKRFDANVSSLKAALQAAPIILDAVRVHLSGNVCFRMIHDLVHVVLVKSPIALKIIRRKMGFEFDIVFHHRVKRVAVSVGDHLSSHLAIALQHPADNDFSVERVMVKLGSLFSVHEAGLTADECFIHFDVPVQFSPVLLHCKPDSVRHEPCGFLGDMQGSVNFIAADSVLVIGEHPHCHEPFIEAHGTVLHDGSNLDAELPPGMVVSALPHTARAQEMDLIAATSGADHFAIWPALLCKIRKAVVQIAEIQDCFLERSWFFDLTCHNEKRIHGFFA